MAKDLDGCMHRWDRVSVLYFLPFPVASVVTGGPAVGEQAGVDVTATGSQKL